MIHMPAKKKVEPSEDKRFEQLSNIIDRSGDITHLMGIDESGTGAWAGPFYLSAVVAPRKWALEGVRDSKKTNKAYREEMFADLEGDPRLIHAEGAATPDDIARLSHAGAYRAALIQAVKGVFAQMTTPKKNVAIIIDGSSNQSLRDALKPFGCPNILFVKKADEFVPHVGAASIFAKFNRDIEMNLLDKKFPGYYFNKNAGYGTAEHIEALVELGPVPHVHRSQS